MTVDGVNNLAERIRRACSTATIEWDLNNAEIIGTLELIKQEVVKQNEEAE